MGFDDSNYHFPQMPTLSINSKTAQDSDRPADQDILESIEAAYFSMNDDFDICRFELSVSTVFVLQTIKYIMELFLETIRNARL